MLKSVINLLISLVNQSSKHWCTSCFPILYELVAHYKEATDQLLCGRRELTSIQLVSNIPGEADSGCIHSKSSGVPEMRVSPSNYDEACLFLYTNYTAVCDQRSITHYGLNHSTFGHCSVTSQHCQIWSECTLQGADFKISFSDTRAKSCAQSVA